MLTFEQQLEINDQIFKPVENNYVKCDGCGGYHPESEVETVVLKLRKGSKCQLQALGTQTGTQVAEAVALAPITLPVVPFVPNPSSPTVAGKPVDINAIRLMEAKDAAKL